MAESLPSGWAATTLGDIVSPSRIRVHPDDAPNMPYVGLEHVEPHTMKLLGHAMASDKKSSSLKFEAGDVLFGKMRPYLNKVWVAEFDGLCSAEFLVFPKTEGLNSKLLGYRLNSPDFVEFANQQVSGERPRVGFAKLSSFQVSLPPSKEQDRIVAKLEELLTKVAAGETAARRALQRIGRYRVSVLRAAVGGELTSDWRKSNAPTENGEQLLARLLVERRAHWTKAEQRHLGTLDRSPKTNYWQSGYQEPKGPRVDGLPILPKDWTWSSIDQLAVLVTSGSRGWKSFYSSNGPLFIRSVDIRTDALLLDDVAHVRPPKDSEGTRTQVQQYDLLVTITGANVGKAAVVRQELTEAYVSQHVALIRFVSADTVKIAHLYITAPEEGRERLLASAYGAGKPGLNLTSLRELAVPLPPAAEQTVLIHEAERRLIAADKLAETIRRQTARAQVARRALYREAFGGKLIAQNPADEHAADLLKRIQMATAVFLRPVRSSLAKSAPRPEKASDMTKRVPTTDDLHKAWRSLQQPDAKKLFDATNFSLDQVTIFYELLRGCPEILDIFVAASATGRKGAKPVLAGATEPVGKPGRFRLVSVWLKDFKNLKDYHVHFDAAHGLDIVLGWNGTGKSNLFESLVIIFRDLHYWWEKNKWPDDPMTAYRLRYEIDDRVVEVDWDPSRIKRPEVRHAANVQGDGLELEFQSLQRENIPLPRFVFGYYSGPTNRLADHFWPMKRDHYERLRKASADDPSTLAELLEQRRFFCAEASHAKYVLLAFAYKEDPKIWRFLEDRMRIVGFESALFVIRKPRWEKGKPEHFWGATGIMRRVMEKLRQYAIAPMVLSQKVADGYRLLSEEHYYFFLPDLKSLHAFAAEYYDARSFFLALESTDFSELIHDVRIQVRVKDANNQHSSVIFREFSEGEQQLLMVLGLMRFTKSHQSLVLLDEPDTHLNPHWSVNYLRDLASVISDDNDPSPEQKTSQLLMATHDPLVIASLLKDQVHLLKRDRDSLVCYSRQASENPRGLGYTGILLSDMFGFRSDLDEQTLSLLDQQARLSGKSEMLTAGEKEELRLLNEQVEQLGFKTVSSDPYYRAFIEALARDQKILALMQKPFRTPEEQTAIRKAADDALARVARKHRDRL